VTGLTFAAKEVGAKAAVVGVVDGSVLGLALGIGTDGYSVVVVSTVTGICVSHSCLFFVTLIGGTCALRCSSSISKTLSAVLLAWLKRLAPSNVYMTFQCNTLSKLRLLVCLLSKYLTYRVILTESAINISVSVAGSALIVAGNTQLSPLVVVLIREAVWTRWLWMAVFLPSSHVKDRDVVLRAFTDLPKGRLGEDSVVLTCRALVDLLSATFHAGVMTGITGLRSVVVPSPGGALTANQALCAGNCWITVGTLVGLASDARVWASGTAGGAERMTSLAQS
jgi:hypothetical protein